jgi:RND family efflux transporter MFP subunit
MDVLEERARRTRRDRLVGLLVVIFAIALTAAIAGVLHLRAAASGEPPLRAPLPVAVATYHHQDSYRRQTAYLGVAVAARKANIGFEVPGQVASTPLREGTPVSTGQVIATLDTAALQAERRATAAVLARVRAELELAQLKTRRQRELQETGAVSREAYDETRLRAQALAAQVEASEAQLASIDIKLEKSRLLAPYDGIIADRYVHQGAVVAAGTPVVRLLQTDHPEAHIGVAVDRAVQLRPGDHHPLQIRNQAVTATLLSIRPDVDPITRVTTAVFALPAQLAVMDGEPVTLQLEEPVPLAGGWLPLGALIEGERGVWNVLRITATDDGEVAVREVVEVLEVQGGRAYVRGTLADGSRVVAGGTHRLAPGSRVLPVGEE